MKIIFTGDNHVFYSDQRKAVQDMMTAIRKEHPDVVCSCGDVGEVLISRDFCLVEELFSINPTLWIAGNHDLYSQERDIPPVALDRFLKVIKCGIPLQTSWTDTKTVYEKDGVLFLGTMGLCDFSHPKMMMPVKYYDARCCTIDGEYLNLKCGFVQYANTLSDAFEKKLKLVDESACKNIIIITHYSIFESQYKLSYDEEISAYFYSHGLGKIVKEVAKRNPDKKFYCISGHGHFFNRGEWISETSNIIVHGIKTDYNLQRFEVLEI